MKINVCIMMRYINFFSSFLVHGKEWDVRGKGEVWGSC